MQNATRPDVDKLISGGQARKRRRNAMRAGGAAVAVVLVGGGVYAVTQLDGGDAGSTGTPPRRSDVAPSGDAPPPTLSEDGGPRARHVPAPGGRRRHRRSDRGGPHRRGPGLGRRGTSRSSRRAPSTAASASTSPRRSRPAPAAAATRRTSPWARPRGPSRSSSHSSHEARSCSPSRPPRRTATTPSTCGCEIADDCPEGQAYRVAETPRGSRGISYSIVPATVVMDFWVLDLDGVGGGRRLAPARRLGRPGGPGRPGPRVDHVRDGGAVR